ncbi:DUF5682 family protein [Shewanella algae]|uniref:DUF5682 family protein n=1 Tax=Shewanella algae TaxID=38313 RepID=UPI0031F54DE6
MKNIHYFGIRHHGPGSARRLVAALERLNPALVLIEGPADCSELVPFLASDEMKPPVALLSFVTDETGHSLYYPFAEYSPEYQACRWALNTNTEVRFIDLPVSVQLASRLQDIGPEPEDDDDTATEADDTDTDSASLPEDSPAPYEGRLRQDPVSALALLAGYEDGESWWNHVIEQGSDDDPELFDALAQAMAELRSAMPNDSLREAQREAFMRLQIAEAAKQNAGPIAVVCGAWHLPGLKTKVSQKEDKAQLKSLPAKLAPKRVSSTWIPWTSPRLASESGYGAGVAAPMWYSHLWQHGYDEVSLTRWLTQVADMLRAAGLMVSTAAVIETLRLCHSLAAIRARPSPGFEEARDASIATMCGGEARWWQQISQQLLLGSRVGEIPADVPLAPLLDDLQRWQKKTRLKSEALPRELSLDLRSESGQLKSWFLHRLRLLDVPWGEQGSAGASRGTFRERWVIAWQPEFAVQLVENQIYGSSLVQAAAERTIQRMREQRQLGELANLVLEALEAELPRAVELGFELLAERAAHTAEGLDLLDCLPPLVDISRYGTSRNLSLAHVNELIERLAVQASLSLPIAVRQLNEDESNHYRLAVGRAHAQLELAQVADSVMEGWWQALIEVVNTGLCDAGVRGLCCRLLYQAKRLDEDYLAQLMAKMLSPANPIVEAKGFFEGFFSGAAERLLYDPRLRQSVDNWLLSLEEEAFVESLPLLRRVFAELDAMERRRLLDSLNAKVVAKGTEYSVNDALVPLWSAHLEGLGKLLAGDNQWMN